GASEQGQRFALRGLQWADVGWDNVPNVGCNIRITDTGPHNDDLVAGPKLIEVVKRAGAALVQFRMRPDDHISSLTRQRFAFKIASLTCETAEIPGVAGKAGGNDGYIDVDCPDL